MEKRPSNHLLIGQMWPDAKQGIPGLTSAVLTLSLAHRGITAGPPISLPLYTEAS